MQNKINPLTGIRKNDTIRFLDSVGGGKVIQVDEEKQLVWVETDDGFDVGPIPAAQCVPALSNTDYMRRSRVAPAPKITPETYHEPELHTQNRLAVGHRSQRQRDELIFDLHIQALPTNGNNMTDVEKHRYQLQFFRLQMQQNIRFRGRRLVFIHGKGNGVLKNEIRQELKRNYKDKIEIHDADFARFEDGATLVIIK